MKNRFCRSWSSAQKRSSKRTEFIIHTAGCPPCERTAERIREPHKTLPVSEINKIYCSKWRSKKKRDTQSTKFIMHEAECPRCDKAGKEMFYVEMDKLQKQISARAN